MLTTLAAELLEKCEFVVADRLISPEIVCLCGGEVLYAPEKKGGESDKAQDEMNSIILQKLKEGKHVLRLKIGDPYLFGRGGEEVMFFRKHGYDPIVIPGTLYT